MKNKLITLGAFLTSFLICNLSNAETLTIDASQSTWIRSDGTSPGRNFGGAPRFAVGGLPTGEGRGLLSFDFSGTLLPEGASISSVSLELHFFSDTSSTATILTVNVYELTQPFVQGVLDGGESAVSATWLRYGSGTWATPGGDYDSTVLATTDISTHDANGIKSWEGSGLTSLVSSALEEQSMVNLLLKVENLTAGQRQLLWFGKQNENMAAHLVIEYSNIPEPATTALLVSGVVLAGVLFLRRRRSQA